MNTKNKRIGDQISERLGSLFAVAMLVILPLACPANYMYLTKLKLDIFEKTTLAVTVLLLIAGVVKVIQRKRLFAAGYKIQITFTDICALLFAYGILFSCLNSEMIRESFLGERGRMLGGVVLWFSIAAYFVVSRYYKFSSKHLWILTGTNIVYWIIVICNFWDVDILNVKETITNDLWGTYMGTLGNINTNSGYSSVVLSVFLVCLFMSEKKVHTYIYYAMVVLGFYACFATQSESWIIAVGAVVLVLFWKAFQTQERLWHFQLIWWAWITASILMKVSLWRMGQEAVPIASWTRMNSQWMAQLFLKNEVLTVQLLILFTGMLLHWKKCSINLKIFRNIMFALVAAVCVSGIALVILANTTTGDGTWRTGLKIGDAFASNRGYAWKRVVIRFKERPFLKQLFGVGPSCFTDLFTVEDKGEMLRLFRGIFIDAHNEFLHFLAITGWVGALSYFGMQFSNLIKGWKAMKKQPMLLAGVAAMTAYMVQAWVNNPLIPMIPLYFIVMGMIQSELRRIKREEMKVD